VIHDRQVAGFTYEVGGFRYINGLRGIFGGIYPGPPRPFRHRAQTCDTTWLTATTAISGN